MGEYSEAYKALLAALEAMRKAKPQERSDLARNYAVAITDLEKLMAYYRYFSENA
jgi:glycerol-3-phosphate O-acyltransferase